MVSPVVRAILGLGAVVVGTTVLIMSAFISAPLLKTLVAPSDGTTKLLSLVIPAGAPVGSTIKAKITAKADGQEVSQIVIVTVKAPQCSDGIDNDDPEDTVADAADPGCQKFFTGEYTPLKNSETDFTFTLPGGNASPSPVPGKVECNDGIDNDNDGYIDFGDDITNDFGCETLEDTSERNADAYCDDGIDNDGDGLTDCADPACYQHVIDQNGVSQKRCVLDGLVGTRGEHRPKYDAVCWDEIDNDNDGTIDCSDPGCWTGNYPYADSSCPKSVNSELGSFTCDDGIDNDGDKDKPGGGVDFRTDGTGDPDCKSLAESSEYSLACSDGKDNDGDDKIDYKIDGTGDPGCENADDTDEIDAPQCGDKKDNDGDGKIDYPADTECRSTSTPYEDDRFVADCSDRRDNDGDGRADVLDPDCKDAEGNYIPLRNSEQFFSPGVCSDGKDNDGDGLIDYQDGRGDPGCAYEEDSDEYTLQCIDRLDNDGDGLIDNQDPGCDPFFLALDDDEKTDQLVCGDDIDNDGDGKIDYPSDPGCESNQSATEEIIYSGTAPGIGSAYWCPTALTSATADALASVTNECKTLGGKLQGAPTCTETGRTGNTWYSTSCTVTVSCRFECVL